jgi:hypothetical protein
MSGTIPITGPGIPPEAAAEVKATNTAISFARNAPELLDGLKAANPAMAAQLTGTVATYSKSGAAPLVGSIVGWLAAHFALMCSSAVASNCWTQDTVNIVTALCIAAGTSLFALGMHWWSKAPTRALVAPAPPTA